MANNYAKEFLVTTNATENGLDHSYPLAPLEGRVPGPYAALGFTATITIDPALTHLLHWAGSDPKASAKGKELAALPLQRPITLAAGKTADGLDPDENRVYYKEGGLAFAVGEVKRGGEACEKCRGRGKGPFAECVVVAGFSGGSCANCHYYSHGGRCSLRQ